MFLEIIQPPFLIAILLALTVHEWAHARVADYLGDPTPRDAGRLTLNPIAHLDPLGTLLFFVIRFGWGKPVPINPRYFKDSKKGAALVAVAGPCSNFIIAFVAYTILLFLAPHLAQSQSAEALLSASTLEIRTIAFFGEVFANLLFLNLGLMAFNLLPIAPLDGSNILGAFIPLRYEVAYENFMQKGPFILLTILLLERIFSVPLLLGWISFFINSALAIFHFVG